MAARGTDHQAPEARVWERLPLTADECALLDGVKWRAVSRETAQAVAEGWNAGVSTAEMAELCGTTPGTFRILIGKLKQIGLNMRRAGEAPSSEPRPPVSLPPPEPKWSDLSAEQVRERLGLRKFSWER